MKNKFNCFSCKFSVVNSGGNGACGHPDNMKEYTLLPTRYLDRYGLNEITTYPSNPSPEHFVESALKRNHGNKCNQYIKGRGFIKRVIRTIKLYDFYYCI